MDQADRFVAENGWTWLPGGPGGIARHSILGLQGAIAIENAWRLLESDGRAMPDSARSPDAMFEMP
ncbi:MAG TPA: hypothetical protein VME17_09390 [Bryobacteraceae bacterium]|nr:hypothetical protein [Bryobacteraceae bacterium]